MLYYYWWYFGSSFGLVVWLLDLICKIILDSVWCFLNNVKKVDIDIE